MTTFEETEQAARRARHDQVGMTTPDDAVGLREHPVQRPDAKASDPPPVPPIRASDADRTDTVARLYHALGTGCLDLAETEERVAAAYAARYRSELAPLLADLPDPSHTSAPMSPAPTWGAVWTTTVWRARASLMGTAGSADAPPTAAECRIAAAVVALALFWMTMCAVLGAALVGR